MSGDYIPPGRTRPHWPGELTQGIPTPRPRMADETPVAPPPAPAPAPQPAPLTLKWAIAAALPGLVVGALLFFGATAIYDRFHVDPPPTAAITGTTDARDYTLARLHLSGAAPGSAAWDVVYGGDVTAEVDGEPTGPDGNSYVFTGRPGIYRVTAWGLLNGKMMRRTATVTVTTLNPGPTPGPTPGPGPEPLPPVPAVTGPLRVVAIYDLDALASLSPAQRDLRTSLTISDSLKSLDATWRSADSGSISAAWKKAIAGQKLPVLAIESQTNQVVRIVPMPSSEAEVVALVAKLRGK